MQAFRSTVPLKLILAESKTSGGLSIRRSKDFRFCGLAQKDWNLLFVWCIHVEVFTRVCRLKRYFLCYLVNFLLLKQHFEQYCTLSRVQECLNARLMLK